MEKCKITETINRLFVAVDERNWEQVSDLFAEKVLLDYSSMGAGAPVQLTAQQIIDSWKKILPGFDKTHHQTGNFIVSGGDNVFHVFCYGTATHFLKTESGNNIWTVTGTYEFQLSEIHQSFKIHLMRFNFRFMDGNEDIPRLAGERASHT